MAAGKDGVMYSAGYQKTAAGYDFCVIKWSKTGAPLWKRSLQRSRQGLRRRHGRCDRPLGQSSSSAANPAVPVRRTGRWSSWTPSGQRRWVWAYDGAAHQDDLPRELVVDGSGNTYVAGRVNAVAGADSAFTVKLSPRARRSGRDGSRGATVSAAPPGA